MTKGPKAPVLVIGVGNPSRGDDAIGPTFVELAAETLKSEVARGEVEFLTDFQLQIEHAMDIDGRAAVVFVDAVVSEPATFEWRRVTASEQASAFTHAMSPEAVLHVLRDVIRGPVPGAWVLAVRGEEFELGASLSERARENLDGALEHFTAELRAGRLVDARPAVVNGTR